MLEHSVVRGEGRPEGERCERDLNPDEHALGPETHLCIARVRRLQSLVLLFRFLEDLPTDVLRSIIKSQDCQRYNCMGMRDL